MKNVLIVGGDSFIASYFIERNKERNKIIAFSRKKTGFENEIVIDSFTKISIEDLSLIDVVINFAAIVHKHSKISYFEYKKVNFILPVELAFRAKQAGVAQFIQMSTISVYGFADYIDIKTEGKPVNDYGRSKLLADNELMKLDDEKFKVTIIRSSMVYGGGNAPGNMMRLIRLIDKGIPLPFKGLKNKRYFLNIENLITFIQESLEMKWNGVLLASDNRGISTSELVSIISDKLGRKNLQFRIPTFVIYLLEYISPSIFNSLFGSLVIDCNENFKKTGIRSKFTIEQGIEKMVERYLKE